MHIADVCIELRDVTRTLVSSTLSDLPQYSVSTAIQSQQEYIKPASLYCQHVWTDYVMFILQHVMCIRLSWKYKPPCNSYFTISVMSPFAGWKSKLTPRLFHSTVSAGSWSRDPQLICLPYLLSTCFYFPVRSNFGSSVVSSAAPSVWNLLPYPVRALPLNVSLPFTHPSTSHPHPHLRFYFRHWRLTNLHHYY